MKKLVLLFTFLSLAAALTVSTRAMADADVSRLAARYAAWAGSRSNADSIVNGLRHGDSITLVTVAPDNTRRLAGFTAQTQMSPPEISKALAQARRTLASLGIRKPHADQIQSSLIGGEVALPGGKTRLIQGSVALRMEPETLSPVAVR